jgi:4-amino-4-deoxy-L-arabinose transferase-like glycosyltransferase
LSKTCSKPAETKNIVNISILLAVALCLGMYLVITTTLIAGDGVIFIEYAKGLDGAFIETVQHEYQHPGYPLLILATYKISQLLHIPASLSTWIYSGQSVTLMFKLLTVSVLYFVGTKLTSRRMSFWALLILIVLPLPAEYGSDVLSDWPNMFFLALGFLLLLHGAGTGKWWPFAYAGLAAGAGYLIRPECAQLVVFGVLWLTLQLFRPGHLGQRKAILALCLMVAGFFVIAGPYMAMKGAVFPKKNVGRITKKTPDVLSSPKNEGFQNPVAQYESGFSPVNTVGAIRKLADNIGRTLMWFFVPALLIGILKSFKGQKYNEPEKFFIVALINLNILLMVWLYCKYGYMSTRHTMALSVFTVFYVPPGLEVLAFWIESRFGRSSKQPVPAEGGLRFWFLILMVTGICVCIPKLLRPIRAPKKAYREAADWVRANTETYDMIAVPDKRIAFYAERKGLIYDNGKIPQNAVYVVKIFGRKDDPALSPQEAGKVEYKYVDEKNGKTRAVIYRNF